MHTIVQFRAIDFGMESCTLAFDFPAAGDQPEPGATFDIRPSSRFDVFRLDIEKKIDTDKLSFSTRPPVLSKVATIEAHIHGMTVITEFPCPSMSLYGFEIACAKGSDCFLDVWTSQNKTYGEQHPPDQTPCF